EETLFGSDHRWACGCSAPGPAGSALRCCNPRGLSQYTPPTRDGRIPVCSSCRQPDSVWPRYSVEKAMTFGDPALTASTLVLCAAAALAAQSNAPPNPFDTPEGIERGRVLFQTHCSYCHGTKGEGGRGADLTGGQYRHGGSEPELFGTVRNGIG